MTLDGKVQLVAADTTKTKSSLRTLPLVPFVKERLLVLKKEQENNRRLCGRSYHKQFAGYVCINEMGDLIKPHYVTEQFPKRWMQTACGAFASMISDIVVPHACWQTVFR